MVYRDRPDDDPRATELLARIAAEPAHREELARVRREHAELTELEDSIGPARWHAVVDLDKRREGGVVATLTDWFGRSIEEHEADVARIVDEHDKLTAKIEALTQLDQELSRKVMGVADARADLERLDLEAIDVVRAAEGPNGDEVRALDVDDARDDGQRFGIEHVIGLCDQARTALWTIEAILYELAAVTGTGSSVMAVLERIESPLDTPHTVEIRKRIRVRIADAVPYVGQRLDELVKEFDLAGVAWCATIPRGRVTQLAALPVAYPTEQTECVKNLEPLVECVTELIAGLVARRDRIDLDRHARDLRRREIAGRVRA